MKNGIGTSLRYSGNFPPTPPTLLFAQIKKLVVTLVYAGGRGRGGSWDVSQNLKLIKKKVETNMFTIDIRK